MKKLLVAALASALLLTGCSAPEPVNVPDVVGMQGDEASDALEEAGFEVKLDAGEEAVWMPSNWIVESQSPSAGTEGGDGDEVVLKVSKPAPAPVEEAPAEEPAPVTPAPASATSLGLTVGFAITACDNAGKNNAPYGWNADFILDGTHEIRADDIFLKAGVDITNAYNAEGRFTVECVVGGTNEAPVVTSFNVY